MLLTLALLVPLGAGPAAAAPVDDYAGYDGQSTCARAALPGTDYLLRWLVRQYPGTRSVSTLRACTDGTSEHKDGRALDWGVDAADPKERATAQALLERLFATDKRGNEHALARRMGIMYVIWDDHIYRAYDGFARDLYTRCVPRSDCSKTSRHRDHVHISLSRSGAAGHTTFYRARNVPRVPVFYPGTRKLDPEATSELTYRVPATRKQVVTDVKLVRGTTYRIVASGLVRYGAGARVASAACRWKGDGWVPGGRLRVNGVDPFAASGDPVDCSSHTVQTSYTPTRTEFLRLRSSDATFRDNEGSLVFSVLRQDLPMRTVAVRYPATAKEPRPARRAGARAKQLAKEVVTVPARARRGVRTTRAVLPRNTYRVVVTGVADSGQARFDGRCVGYAGRLRPQHSLDLTDPAADHLALYVQGVKLDLRAAGTSAPCSAKHRYVARWRPTQKGRARLKIWDPSGHADNSGALRVLVRRR